MEISVRLAEQPYTIIVERDARRQVGRRLRQLDVGRRAALVSPPGVLAVYGKDVVESLEAAGIAVTVVEIPDGEAAKSVDVAARAWDALLAAGLDRTSTVVALGGGAAGDVAGFVAATYMRGTNFVPVPTTLLAQVDASIGGKTAIDHPGAKNLIGAFHQPRLVVADTATLATLPEREYRSGLAEVVKHGVVLDAGYFADLEDSREALRGRDVGVLERVVAGSCRLKASVVERDAREQDLRAVLNYGHTVGHALETVTGYSRFTHGEAVALGMVVEARLARRLGLASAETAERQEGLLEALGLPVRMPPLEPAALLAAMARDKKSRNGRVPFVLAPAIGAFRIVYDVPGEEVSAAMAEVTEKGPR